MYHSNVFWYWNVQSNESAPDSMLAMDLFNDQNEMAIWVRICMYHMEQIVQVRVDALIDIKLITAKRILLITY